MIETRSRTRWRHRPLRAVDADRLRGVVMAAVVHLAQPGMVENVVEARSVGGVERQAAQDEVLAAVGDRLPKAHLRLQDLGVVLERNVAVCHVVQQDAQ